MQANKIPVNPCDACAKKATCARECMPLRDYNRHLQKEARKARRQKAA